MRWRRHWSPLDGDFIIIFFSFGYCFTFVSLFLFRLSEKKPFFSLKRYFGNICKMTYFVQQTALFIWCVDSWRNSICPGNALLCPAAVKSHLASQVSRERQREMKIKSLGHIRWQTVDISVLKLSTQNWRKPQGTFLSRSPERKSKPCTLPFTSLHRYLKLAAPRPATSSTYLNCTCQRDSGHSLLTIRRQ